MILTSLMHQLIGWTMYGGQVKNATIYFVGIVLCMITWAGIFLNEQKLYERQGEVDYKGPKTHRNLFKSFKIRCFTV